MRRPIYLDHAATTPLRAEVRAAMEPFLVDNYANPSSIYRLAQFARSALDDARDTIALALGARPSEIMFTSGGTESNNAAIKGTALVRPGQGGHLITTAIEHHAVLHPVQELEERFGMDVTILEVEGNGIVDPDRVRWALREDTVLLSVMWANNEIGTIQPIEEIASIARERKVCLHVDAVQAAGTIAIDLRRVPIDLLSISAHKFYGPKGVGALFIRQGTPWFPLLVGGGQERNRRAGTENVAGIVGMGRALACACADQVETNAYLTTLRNHLFDEIRKRIPGTWVNGDRNRRLPNNVNVGFEGVHGESLLVGLDLENIMASSGSACTSGSLDPSHVLVASGVPREQAQASLRLTLGRENTMLEVEQTLDTLVRLVTRLRTLATSDRGI